MLGPNTSTTPSQACHHQRQFETTCVKPKNTKTHFRRQIGVPDPNGLAPYFGMLSNSQGVGHCFRILLLSQPRCQISSALHWNATWASPYPVRVVARCPRCELAFIPTNESYGCDLPWLMISQAMNALPVTSNLRCFAAGERTGSIDLS
jgi:hypothetical protein